MRRSQIKRDICKVNLESHVVCQCYAIREIAREAVSTRSATTTTICIEFKRTGGPPTALNGRSGSKSYGPKALQGKILERCRILPVGIGKVDPSVKTAFIRV